MNTQAERTIVAALVVTAIVTAGRSVAARRTPRLRIFVAALGVAVGLLALSSFVPKLATSFAVLIAVSSLLTPDADKAVTAALSAIPKLSKEPPS